MFGGISVPFSQLCMVNGRAYQSLVRTVPRNEDDPGADGCGAVITTITRSGILMI